MDKFLSCDWGTSSFRIRLVAYESLQILGEYKDDSGIAKTYAAWKLNGAIKAQRVAFYQRQIIAGIKIVSEQSGIDLNHAPVIISGMITATIGMCNVRYKKLPITADASQLLVKTILPGSGNNALILVSGIKTNNNVIRGEETKIIGCIPYLKNTDDESLLIFPGTHSKHVRIINNQVVDFATYMTGEFFDLLSSNGVLAASVEKNKDFDAPENRKAFKQGVEFSRKHQLLQSAFSVRTNDILRKTSKSASFFYLSGLLIGTELQDIQKKHHPIYLCGEGDLMRYYFYAFEIMNIPVAIKIDADLALLNAHRKLYSLYNISST